MAHFGEIFTELLDSSDLTPEQVAERLNCKKSNIYKLKKKESVDLSMLVKVCRVLNVNPVIFFDSDLLKLSIPEHRNVYKNSAVLGKAIMNIGWQDEVRFLKEKLAEKDKLIAEKERLIQLLLQSRPDASL